MAIFSAILIPFAAFAGIVPCGTSDTPECNICYLFQLIDNLVDFLLEVIALPLAVVMFLYGGFMWITAAGDPGKITKGRNALQYAVVGMIVAFAAWLIIDTILKALLAGGMGNIEGWGVWNKIPQCPK